MYAIETRGLTHQFRPAEIALRAIDLEVPTGGIYGFLGPNGAGKTTALRLVLGLLRLQRGTIHVLGRPIGRDRVAILRQVGSCIESPSLYAHLTAVENMRIWQAAFQCPPARIREALRLVGLADTGAKRAGEFSLGMKQRLSIAVALLHQPALLILDEPSNGLDPHGMNEIRDLLTALNRDQGTTIVVSSHLLSEIEKFVTHVGIINRGALMFQGPLASLVAKQEEASFTRIDTSDNHQAIEILGRGGWPARLHHGKVAVPLLSREETARINRSLLLGGVDVHEIASSGGDLESIFMSLIGSQPR